MKIASNQLSELLKYYQTELIDIYDHEELNAIFELVCEYYLSFSKQNVKTKIHNRINQSELINIYNTCHELKTGKPIQYILDESIFYNLKFKLNHSVLIPRPETEELVDIIIHTIQSEFKNPYRIIDIGTGSGCIPIALKKKLKLAKASGIDISTSAIETSILNASLNQVDVDFYVEDIFNINNFQDYKFDVIVSNPPYVLKSESKLMDERVLNFEPNIALFVEENNPIIFYKKIIDLCLHSLSDKGFLFFELNPLFAEDVMRYADLSSIFKSVEILKDMSGKQRFLKAQKT
ncbi:MAG: peptide chain release factor N(5)-glutamine methyltransferase [Bacteroidota bacterium]